MSTDDLFLFQLGQGVYSIDNRESKLLVIERLFAEFLDSSKHRRIMYACKSLPDGQPQLYAQHKLAKWKGTQKTPQTHKTSTHGGKKSQIHIHAN